MQATLNRDVDVKQLEDLKKLACMDTIIRGAKGKDSLETLLKKKIQTEETKFREAGKAYALENGKTFPQDNASGLFGTVITLANFLFLKARLQHFREIVQICPGVLRAVR